MIEETDTFERSGSGWCGVLNDGNATDRFDFYGYISSTGTFPTPTADFPIDNGYCEVYSEQLTVGALDVIEGEHLLVSDNIELIQIHALAVDEAYHEHLRRRRSQLEERAHPRTDECAHDLIDSGPISVNANANLKVNDAYHDHVADRGRRSFSCTRSRWPSATMSSSSIRLSWSQLYSLTVDECYHAHDGPNVDLRTDLHPRRFRGLPHNSFHRSQPR